VLVEKNAAKIHHIFLILSSSHEILRMYIISEQKFDFKAVMPKIPALSQHYPPNSVISIKFPALLHHSPLAVSAVFDFNNFCLKTKKNTSPADSSQ